MIKNYIKMFLKYIKKKIKVVKKNIIKKQKLFKIQRKSYLILNFKILY